MLLHRQPTTRNVKTIAAHPHARSAPTTAGPPQSHHATTTQSSEHHHLYMNRSPFTAQINHQPQRPLGEADPLPATLYLTENEDANHTVDPVGIAQRNV